MRKDALIHWCLARPVRSGIVIFLLAALPRLGYGLYAQTHAVGYAGEMERAAASLATRGDIADSFGPGSGPSAHVAPLYAYLLAFLYRIFGLPDVYGRWAQVLVAVTASSACIALVPWLGRRLGLRPGVGHAAALIAAVLPVNIWVETSGSWEQPLATLCLFGLLGSVMALNVCRWSSLSLVLATGFLVGIAGLLSPVLLPAAVIMLFSEFCIQAGLRKRVAFQVCAIAAVAIICLAPWVIRNYVKLGGLVAFRSNFGLELWIGNNSQTNGATSVSGDAGFERVLKQWHPYCNRAEAARLSSVGELAYMREKQTEALAWIAANPGRFTDLTARRCLLYWLPMVELWPPDAPAQIFKSLTFCLVGAGGLLGLAWAFAAGHRHRWLLLAALVGPSLPYLITHVDPRYRYPTYLLMVLMTCQGICWAFRRERLANSFRAFHNKGTLTARDVLTDVPGKPGGFWGENTTLVGPTKASPFLSRLLKPKWAERLTGLAAGVHLFIRRPVGRGVVTGGGPAGMLFAWLQAVVPWGRRTHIMVDCNWYLPATPWQRRLKAAQLRLAARSVQRFVVWASHEVEDYPRTFGLPPEKFQYVPFHTTLDNYEFEIHDDGYLFAGGNYDRDYRTLVEAVRALDVPTWLATTRPEQLDGVSLPTHVRVQGTSHADFRRAMAGARLVVVPMQKGLLHSGGQQTLLNAMYMGKPTIAVGRPWSEDFVTDGQDGLIVEYEDVVGLRAAICRLLDDPVEARRIAENGQLRARQFTTRRCMESLFQLVTGQLSTPR